MVWLRSSAQNVNHVTFASQASRGKHGLVMIFDLEGFSRFFNQPDISDYVTRFLNPVFEAVDVSVNEGTAYWLSPPGAPPDEYPQYAPLEYLPSHVKFMGDGALYIWTPEKEGKDFNEEFTAILMNRLWNLKTNFGNVVSKCTDDVPVVDLPPRIRFGLARGTIYELIHKNTHQREYIGYCINLASRLQSYCPDLGIIASARLRIPSHILKEHGYMKVVATRIKGFQEEVVVVDSEEFEGLNPKVRDELFAPLKTLE